MYEYILRYNVFLCEGYNTIFVSLLILTASKRINTMCLYMADVQNMVGRVPLTPLFLAGNSTPTFTHMSTSPKIQAFRNNPYGCADAAATDGL